MSTRLRPRGVGGRSEPQVTGVVCFPGYAGLSLRLAALTRAACRSNVGFSPRSARLAGGRTLEAFARS
jgi:hypothetical protein